MFFIDLNLDLEILGPLADNNFLSPRPIQQKAIPLALDGYDLLASAPTGTGKTLAFALPALQKVFDTEQDHSSAPQVLILAPTRELAKQIYQVIVLQTEYNRINSCLIVGGVPLGMQKAMLEEQIDIMVATPGRLLELNAQQWLDLSLVNMLVIDEADRMLDLGFIDDIKQIADILPLDRQTLMFSATLEGEKIKRFASDLLNEDSQVVAVEQPRQIPANIQQNIYQADNEKHKEHLLKALINQPEMKQAIVFVNSRKQVDLWVSAIRTTGHLCYGLHGDLRQSERNQRVKEMRRGKIQVIVATDVVGRGLDLPDLTHVINLYMPLKADTYVHRAGRSGRDGAKGTVWSIVDAMDWPNLQRIERFLNEKLPRATFPGLSPTKPEPGKATKGKAKPKKPKVKNKKSKKAADAAKKATPKKTKKRVGRGPKAAHQKSK
ncbi:DEAD/DEAH box helicase [Amphritea balenae]|uniref:DEAD/DEAH box helicase n=1 Tax=Amphritea balenae TaxID=452629 RepID=A0A3P1SRY7_9GAMM|nr:DEAD/DEAH box helicase [Amphritea balenae]RRC99943.1 DEAD/DEAH box helicase [Amphritea balenae]GGK75312.1 ATP-dependent RNA helicase SrmB [Amphritea balenae]